MTFVRRVSRRTHGCDMVNSCVEHGDGQGLRDVLTKGLGKQSPSVRVPGLGFGNHSKV